ncbi:hypothetical protein O5190_27520, partial [Escherichia coli]|nr:hypothetical protein [Escherichia coli]
VRRLIPFPAASEYFAHLAQFFTTVQFEGIEADFAHRLLVQIQRNGGWVTEKDITIKGRRE